MTKHILVINDTQEILELFRDILESEGYQVTLQSFSLREVETLRQIKCDLIILDYIIGAEDDGWQTLQKLKMSSDLARTPVIICVAASQRVKEMEGRLTEKGIMIVLKPFDIADLLGAVEAMATRITAPPELIRHAKRSATSPRS